MYVEWWNVYRLSGESSADSFKDWSPCIWPAQVLVCILFMETWGSSIAINSLVKSSKDVKLYLLVDSATSVATKITENTVWYYNEHSWSSYFVK